MPNHVTNRLVITGKPTLLDEIQASCAGDPKDQEPTVFDFNKVVPMPEALDIEKGGTGSIGYRAMYGDYQVILAYTWVPDEITTRADLLQFLHDRDPRYIELAEKYRANLDSHGATTWYEWCLTHWGTKWNAYEVRSARPAPEQLVYRFSTAWSPPLPVLEVLSDKFPEANFRLIYIDEMPNYWGACTIEAGAADDNYSESDEALLERLKAEIFDGENDFPSDDS